MRDGTILPNDSPTIDILTMGTPMELHAINVPAQGERIEDEWLARQPIVGAIQHQHADDAKRRRLAR